MCAFQSYVCRAATGWKLMKRTRVTNNKYFIFSRDALKKVWWTSSKYIAAIIGIVRQMSAGTLSVRILMANLGVPKLAIGNQAANNYFSKFNWDFRLTDGKLG